MELYQILTIIDRARVKFFYSLCTDLGIPVIAGMPAQGTASRKHLDFYGLEPTDKSLVLLIADAETKAKVFHRAKERMFIDVPGNGVMMAVPLKSVGGGRTLAFLSGNKPADGSIPDLNVTHELIMVILNRGFTDDVMDAARAAGARGGTVLHAKGTGVQYAEKFFGVTLAEEKEIILIAAPAKERTAIMSEIAAKCGVESKAGAIAFSLPVTEITGIRQPVEE